MANFTRIRKSKLYEEVADEIEGLIINETLKVGEKLPSETVLAEELGVSRNILREAFKVLAERGLITVKTGQGAFVDKPRTRALEGLLNRVVSLNDVSMDQIFEIRRALEGKACFSAASKITEQQMEELEQIVYKMQDSRTNQAAWCDCELRFHTKIAEASGNPLFSFMINAISKLLLDVYESGYENVGAKAEGIQGHQEIIAALQKGDGEQAESRMIKHLELSRSLFENQ